MERRKLEQEIQGRSDVLLAEDLDRVHRQTDSFMSALMGIQWVFGLAAAIWVSPRAWAGEQI